MQGILLLNKPENMTSFGAVAAVRRITHQKRIGHTGTLDPMATGVLPILLGRATALSGIITDADKSYRAKIKLGLTTDTCDTTGKMIAQNDVSVTKQRLDEAIIHFTGNIKQVPPMYSAIKQNGVRLYKLAREGKTVDIPERNITVYSIKLISELSSDNTFIIDAHVSKGTYIRSLARDIGEYLGCGACLSSLCRTSTGGFSLDDCVSLDDLNSENIETYIKNEEISVKNLRQIIVTDKQAERFCHGGQLSFDRLNVENLNDQELFRIKNNDKLIGIGLADINTQLICIKSILNYPEGILV